MVGINPFAKRQVDTTGDLFAEPVAVDVRVNEPMQLTARPRINAWQFIIGVALGDHVAQLPARTIPERLSKRQRRRLRGRRKEMRK
jgi:hypothetical protein